MNFEEAEPRPGTTGAWQGITYEMKILLLFMVRACINKVKFTVKSNIKRFGNFDDIVADCEFSDGSKKYFCLQLKHVTSEKEAKMINLNNLTSYEKSTTVFSLPKYYKELYISNNASSPNCKDFQFIFYTTAADNTYNDNVDLENISSDNMLCKLFDTSGKSNCVNKFSKTGSEKISSAIEDNRSKLKSELEKRKDSKKKDDLKFIKDFKFTSDLEISSDFLQNICIFSNQKEERDIDNIIKQDLKVLIGNTDDDTLQTVFNYILKEVEDFYIPSKDEKPEPVRASNPPATSSSAPASDMDTASLHTGAKTFTNKKFLDCLWKSLIKHLPCLSLINKLEDLLKTYKCKETKMYEEISNDIPVVINTGENANMLALLEYYTTAKENSNKCEINLESFMFVKIEHLGQALNVFRYCRNIIFIDCSAIDSKNCAALQEIQNILSNDKTKKAVLFIPNTLLEFAPVPNIPTNYTFNYDSLNNFNLPIKVKFQGDEVECSDLFVLKELSQYLDTEAVEELLSENIIIGKALNELDAETEHCYLERTYNYRQVVSSDIFKDSSLCDVLFVSLTQHSDLGAYQDKFVNKANVDNISSHSQFYHICDVREENRNKLQHLAENFPKKDKNIHWLQITPDCVLWQDTIGSVQNITKYVKTDEKIENAINKDKFLENAKQINLIVDKAGMGKTTSLIKIAHKLRTKDKNCWIEHIDLSSSKFTDMLLKMKIELKNKAKDEKANVALSFLEDFIICRLPKLSRSIFKYLSNKKQVIFLFDGFDEICPKYEREFKIILQDLMQSNPLQIWLTSRSHMVESLQETFPVFPVNIQPFDENNQIAFYNKYFKKYLEINQNQLIIDEEKIDIFSIALQQKLKSVDKKVLDTMGIPLLTKMFAKINTVKFANFYSQDTDIGDVDISVHNIFELYKNFFDSSIERFLIDKKRSDPCAPHYDLEREIIKYMNIHNLIAAKSLLDEKYISLFSLRNNCDLENINEEQYQIDLIGIGIISGKIEDKKFLHFTFAEYLFANFIKDKLQSPDNTEVLQQLLDEVLHEDKWKTVRIFLNYSNLKLLVNSNYDPTYKFREETADDKDLKVDTVRSTSLIVAAEEGNCNIAEFTLKCVKGNNEEDVKKWMSIKVIRNDFMHHRSGSCAALHVASNYGYNDIVQLLLNYDVDYNQQSDKGYTALMLAARKGHFVVVTELLTRGANVNLVSKSGNTALMLAAQHGHCDVVTALLTHGAEVNHVSRYGDTALMLAAKYGRFDIVTALLTHGADVNHVSRYGNTALMLAAQHGHCDVVTALLTHGADVNHVSRYGNTAQMLAAYHGRFDIVVTELLTLGADVNHLSELGETALILAAQYGHCDIVTALLTHGADVNQVSRYGNTALMLAAKYKRFDIVTELLTHGADVNHVSKYGKTALMLAAQHGRCNVVTSLLTHGADVNHVTKSGKTALMLAAQYRHCDIMTELIKCGADVNLKDEDGYTAILHAASGAAVPVIKQLLESGASLEDKSNRGSTLLLQSATNYHHEVLQYFITTGRYNIYDTDEDGWTALHHAARCGHCLNIQLLLDHEAELISQDNTIQPKLIDCQDNQGQTALHVAVNLFSGTGSLQCVQYLLQRGADPNITDNEGKTALDICYDKETRNWLLENINNTDIVVQQPLCNK